jgi:hypothetical protein
MYAVFQACLMGLFGWWWEKRRPFIREPEENVAWWIHPVYNFRRRLPRADRHTPRRTEPRMVALAAQTPPQRTRPKISNPIPMHQRPRTPPLRRPRRPLSLTNSLMEDMRTSPQPRANSERGKGVQVNDTESQILTDNVTTDKHRSLSPQPLQIVKSNIPPNNSLSGVEFEARNPVPASARSSTSNYSTALPGLAPPKPAYLPYRQPDSPPPHRTSQHSLLRYTTGEQHRTARDDAHNRVYRPAPFGDEDEDDEEVKRIRREESLRMLEENSTTNIIGTLDEVEEDENTSQGSFDFAEARARKALADKRMREEFVRGRAAQDLNSPLPPELPAAHKL